MSKEEKIRRYLEGTDLDPDSPEYQRTVEYAMTKSKPFEFKTCDFHPGPEWDYGLEPSQEIQACICPCKVCGHTYMWECDDANCACCSSACC